MGQLRETPDAGLLTETAIRIRIENLKKQPPIQQTLNRIKRLQERLPKTAGAAITPAVNAALLVSKKDIGWGDSSRSVQGYNSPSCSYQG